MRRLSLAAGLLVLASGVLAPSAANAQQTISFFVGGFVPTGEDGRYRDEAGSSGDVLAANRSFLWFDLGAFHSGTVGADYTVGLGRWLDAGLGVGYYSDAVPAVYADMVNANGSEIYQELKMRQVPFTATVRFLPLGREAGIEPYIGGGVAIVNWRYSETGEFVDYVDDSIFRDSFSASGTAVGPTILGGVRFPFDGWGFGGEVRWQGVEADLPKDLGFATTYPGQTPWLDLGGWSYLTTVHVRF